MADALVKLLNRAGYQPFYLPTAGLEPPEVYYYTRNRLARRGPLVEYLPPPGPKLDLARRELPDITHKQTSKKGLAPSIAFLQRALLLVGIDAPKLNLKFAGTTDFKLAISDAYSISVNPSKIDHILESLDLGAIPDEIVEESKLHIVYEYAYAQAVTLERADFKEFDVDVTGKIYEYFDVGASAQVASESRTRIVFRSDKRSAAFAYKAGRLVRRERWLFYPEETYKAGTAVVAPFVPQLGVMLDVVDEAPD